MLRDVKVKFDGVRETHAHLQIEIRWMPLVIRLPPSARRWNKVDGICYKYKSTLLRHIDN